MNNSSILEIIIAFVVMYLFSIGYAIGKSFDLDFLICLLFGVVAAILGSIMYVYIWNRVNRNKE
jgi:membrane protein DedA with SNARE-associated domain